MALLSPVERRLVLLDSLRSCIRFMTTIITKINANSRVNMA